MTGAADSLRTGWYQDEPGLTPALVGGGSFKRAFQTHLEGQIYAQPLTADGTLLVVTEADRAYGLDPVSGAVRWERSFGSPLNANEPPIECANLQPQIGITGTPVIDTATGVAYFVSARYVTGSSGAIAWYMQALDVATGEEVDGFPVEISGEAQNLSPGVTFTAAQELQRPALLLMGGVAYAAFGSNCDKEPYQGWIAGVSTSAKLTTMWAVSADGGSIWQSGGGLVSDGPGQILFATGNDTGTPGAGDPPPGPGGKPPEGRLGESVVRTEVQGDGQLKASDFFSPSNNAKLDSEDFDLGSGAPVALPAQYFGTPTVPELLVQAGKEGYIYLLNRRALGGMAQGPGETDRVVQRLGPYGGVWDGSAVWPGDGGYVYIPSVGYLDERLRFFRYEMNEATGEPSLSVAASVNAFGYGSGSPIVTSDGTAAGTAILWITRCPPPACEESAEPSALRAYGAVPASGAAQLLWEAPIGIATKFSRPDAQAGHVYVGNAEGSLFGYSGPALTPSTTSLDLGSAPVGSQLTAAITLTDTGIPLTVSAVRAPPAPFTASGLPAVGSTIEPGQTITVNVTFSPATPGSFSGSLELSSAAGETTIALAGSAPGAGSLDIPASLPGSLPPPLAIPAVLTDLRIGFAAHARGRRSIRALVSYALSAAGRVEVQIQREVVSHSCRRGAPTCIHYAPTPIRLKAVGHAGRNVLSLDLQRLAPGRYRLLALPLSSSGARGITRYLSFTAPR